MSTIPLSARDFVVPSASTSAPPVAPTSTRLSAPHIPSLDGLRAVSFFIVFLAHSGVNLLVPAIPGGFGVTVFFFLSGYLITTLLRIEQETTGTVSIRNFYLRRALRILPPFYLVLIAATLLAMSGAMPAQPQRQAVLAQALHFANYWFIFHGAEGAPPGTVPYWSLAVEEHFYLVFPLLYVAVIRHLSKVGQATSLWTLCALVCLWRVILVFGLEAAENRTYMASDTRFDSILFGCGLAVGMNPMLDRRVGSDWVWKWVLLPAGLVLLLVTFAYRAPWFRETIRYSLQGLALIPVFVAAIRFPRWLPFRFLNLKPVAFVGVLSYTLYLTHQVALIAVEFWAPSLHTTAGAGVALLIALVIALAIHRFVELPSARLRKQFAQTSAFRQAAPAAR